MERHTTIFQGLPVVAFYDDEDGHVDLRSVEWREMVELINGMTPEEIRQIEIDVQATKIDALAHARDAWIDERIDRRKVA